MIQLIYPWALLALLSIPIILILHSLRPKRRTLVLSTTRLWREALREQQRGLGLQKLLRDISLILLLLFALVLSLGLSAPQWLTQASEQQDTVLVLDVSASMQAGNGSGARFEQAQQEAAELVESLPEGGRIAIMTSGRNPVLRSAFESKKATLLSVLNEIKPTDEAGRPREALALALSLLRNRERSRIHFFTDAAFDSDVDFSSPLIEYHVVGNNDSSRNVAITRFDFRPEIGSEERFQMQLSVRNYSAETLDVPVLVTLNRSRLLQQTLQLAPAAEQIIVLPFRGRAIGRAQASLEFDDDLAADNQAFAVMAIDEGLRILLLSPGNFYLESVLNALANVNVTKQAEAPDAAELARQARRYDLVVFDRIAAPPLPAGNYLLIDTLPPDLPLQANATVSQPLIAGKSASTLMQSLDLTGVRIERAQRVRVNDETPGLQRLFWSAETDLALALLQQKHAIRLVYLGFDLTQSNFPLQAAFPLFISQTLAWLQPRADGFFSNTQIAAGEPFTIKLAGEQSRVIIGTPSGEGLIYDLDNATDENHSDSFLFDATSNAGIYRYTVGEIERYFAVNLTDEHESDISARALIPTTPASITRDDELTAQIALALWPYCTALALILLTLEWLLWCTRRGSA